MNLVSATIYYGSQPYPVRPNATTPVPETFDFNDVEGCARKVFAVMSNASGGHMIHDCRVHVHHGRQTASLVGNGVAVHYAPLNRSKLTVAEALQAMEERITIQLGRVTTDQYGNGWQRAKWVTA
jgi:hypothetical protein